MVAAEGDTEMIKCDGRWEYFAGEEAGDVARNTVAGGAIAKPEFVKGDSELGANRLQDGCKAFAELVGSEEQRMFFVELLATAIQREFGFEGFDFGAEGGDFGIRVLNRRKRRERRVPARRRGGAEMDVVCSTGNMRESSFHLRFF